MRESAAARCAPPRRAGPHPPPSPSTRLLTIMNDSYSTQFELLAIEHYLGQRAVSEYLRLRTLLHVSFNTTKVSAEWPSLAECSIAELMEEASG
jgi:hypothetical protein